MTVVKLPAVYLDAGFSRNVQNAIVVTLAEPFQGTPGWPLDQLIFFELADISASGAILATVRAWVNGQLALDLAGGAPVFKPPYDGPSSSVKFSASPGSGVSDVVRVVIDPTTLWSSEETVTVRVTADSTGGYSLDTSWTFSTRDVVAPQVSEVRAVSPRRVEVTYNEPVLMDASSGGALNQGNYALDSDDSPYYLPTSFEVEQVSNYSVAMVFDEELSHGREYVLTVSGVEDDSGNALGSQDVAFSAVDLLDGGDRDFDLWSMIPGKLRRWDRSLTGSSPGDTQRFFEVLQEVADLLWYDADLLRDFYDIDLAPMDSVELLLQQFGNPFPFTPSLSDLAKRKLLRNLVAIYQEKGTVDGIVDAIFFFMGIPVTITRPMETAWRIGYDKLGLTTYLGPSSSYDRFTFFVVCPVYLTTDQRKQMNDLIKLMKAAHEHHVIVEPAPPAPAVWKVGYHKLGVETRLGG